MCVAENRQPVTSLSPQDYSLLKLAIEDEFSTKAELSRLARQTFERSLDLVALGDDLTEIIEKVINVADNEHRLSKLIEVFGDLRPESPNIARLRGAFAVIITLETDDQCDAHLLRGWRALVDRRRLRDALRTLNSPNGSRILIVDGDRFSGKTYSSQLISHMAGPWDFSFVWTDLERLARTEPGPISAAALGRDMAQQMGFIGMPDVGTEQDARWVRSFCNWLTPLVDAERARRWIVIDSFGKALLSDGVHLLIQELALRIDQNLSRLRLVLLSYGDRDTLEAMLGGAVEYERIARIGARELTEFFSRLYLERERRHEREVAMDELSAEIRRSVARVQAAAARDDPRRLFAVGRAVSQEARVILGA
jgi:hypothetical protein